MGASKTDPYSTLELTMSKLAQALAHPARWRIVNLIAERGSMCCYQIMREVPLSQPTISQHLYVLQRCGVISSAYLFNETMYYYLSSRSLVKLSEGVYDVFILHQKDKNFS